MTNFLGLEPEFSGEATAGIEVLPVPYEKTTSYGTGTDRGPEAIIEASGFVELYDEVYQTEAYRRGVYTHPELKFSGDSTRDFELITGAVKSILDKNRFPVILGGEHSLSFPVYRAFHEKFTDLTVLQFDAHSDLRYSYEDSIYSHASVMHRIYELNPDIVQVGIRSQCIEEAEFIREKSIKTFYAHQVHGNGFDGILKDLKKNVFITFDIDYFDPSIMPATGTPEPGGFLWNETIRFLEKVFAASNVVGFDLVELSPLQGYHAADFLAAKLVYKMITLKFKSESQV